MYQDLENEGRKLRAQLEQLRGEETARQIAEALSLQVSRQPGKQMNRWILNEVNRTQTRLRATATAPKIPKSNALVNAALRAALGKKAGK